MVMDGQELVLQVSGALDQRTIMRLLAVIEAARTHQRAVALDLTNLRTLDAAGLRAFRSAQEQLYRLADGQGLRGLGELSLMGFLLIRLNARLDRRRPSSARACCAPDAQGANRPAPMPFPAASA
jgi:ABC-type transporter Mla MlaB component